MHNREARYYAIPTSGSRALQRQAERLLRLASLVDNLLLNER